MRFFGSQENPPLEKPPYARTNLALKLQFRLLSLQIPLFLAHFDTSIVFSIKNYDFLTKVNAIFDLDDYSLL